MRPSLVTVGVCIAAIALLPVTALAQQPPPVYVPPPPQYAPPPPQYYAPPPPQYYAPPPPQYYAPPPPQYYAPPRYYVAPRPWRPSNGIGAIIAGSILLGVGLVFIGVSLPLWSDGCGATRTCFNDPSSIDYDNASGAVALDVVGGLLFTVGAVLLPVGIVQATRYGRWRHGQRVQVAPTGLKLTF